MVKIQSVRRAYSPEQNTLPLLLQTMEEGRVPLKNRRTQGTSTEYPFISVGKTFIMLRGDMGGLVVRLQLYLSENERSGLDMETCRTAADRATHWLAGAVSLDEAAARPKQIWDR
ncbi:hypothetical protein L228DRAFT_269615 [Xylona heveae TC161]|uniref:Uncharacterized protein n=1 Tax=Xylona heveae (strain CBS 132557 / TC161) TaxID=1328760 RepID=A0A165FPF1_XYLHT|nr:hypothetical protein L228DRAFT_269615 [Xylona heveae TC161]KZF21224.1 hypothetical protein L228DRAFT_269615 [Xylona heveae TC161]